MSGPVPEPLAQIVAGWAQRVDSTHTVVRTVSLPFPAGSLAPPVTWLARAAIVAATVRAVWRTITEPRRPAWQTVGHITVRRRNITNLIGGVRS